jgi:hypothetical protein
VKRALGERDYGKRGGGLEPCLEEEKKMPDDSIWTLAWRIFSPLFYIPWIIVAFLYTLLIAGSAFLRRFAISLTTPRGLIPFILLAIGMFGLVFQYNQDFVVQIADTVTACWDEIYASIIKAIFDDIIRCLWPLCTLYNFIVMFIKFNIRLLVNEVRCFITCDEVACGCGDASCEFEGGAFHFFEEDECCVCFKTAFVFGLEAVGIPSGTALDILNTVLDFLDITPPPNAPLFNDWLDLFPNPEECDWVWMGPDDTTACNTDLTPGKRTEKDKRAIPDFIIDAFTAPDGAEYSTLFFYVLCGQAIDPVIEIYAEIGLWLFHFLNEMLSIGFNIAGDFLQSVPENVLDVIRKFYQEFVHEFLCLLLDWIDLGFVSDDEDDPGSCCETLSFSSPLDFVESLFTGSCLGPFGELLTCFIENAASPAAIFSECLDIDDPTDCLVDGCSSDDDCGESCSCVDVGLFGSFCQPFSKKRDIERKVESMRKMHGNETAAAYRTHLTMELYDSHRQRIENAPKRARQIEERKRRDKERTKTFIENIQKSALLTEIARQRHAEFLESGHIKAAEIFSRYLPKEIVEENHRQHEFQHTADDAPVPREDWSAGGKYVDQPSYTLKYGVSGIYSDQSGFFSGLGTIFNILTDQLHRRSKAHVEYMNQRTLTMLNDHYERGGTLRDLGYHPSVTDTHLVQDGQRAIEAATSWMQDARHIFSFMRWNPHKYDFDAPSKRDMESMFDNRKLGSKLFAFVTHGTRFIRTSNHVNYPRGERPAFYIEMEVTIKMIVRRFISPDSLHTLRDTLARKGESYRLAATRIINPAIEQYQQQLERRDAARALGESGIDDQRKAPKPMVEPITLQSWLEWSKAAWIRKRERAAAAGTPLTPEQERGVSPEIVALSRDHIRRLRAARTPYQAFREFHTTATRLPQLAAVAGVVWPLIKNYKVVAGAAVPFLTSPYGQIILGRYGDFGIDVFGEIFNKPLDDLLTPGFLLDVGEDFTLITLDNILYLTTELIRFLFCQWFSIVLMFIKAVAGPFLSLIPYVGAILSTVVGWLTTGGALLTPLISYCPPEPVVIDNVPQQRPWNWFLDILDCDSTQACTTEADCPGQAPCRCSPAYGDPGADVGQPQYTTFFWQLDGDYRNPCPGDSGVCLCWPELPCDTQLPPLVLNELFDQDCRDFGYNIDDIIPWNYDGNGVGFFTFIITSLENALVSLRFITRTIVRGYEPFISMDAMLLVSGLVIGFSIMFGRWVWLVVLVVVLFGITYGSPLLTTFTEDVLIPGLEDIASRFPGLEPVTDFLLDFLRFDDNSPAEPIGEPDPAEFTCFLLNTPTMFTGFAAGLVFFSILYSAWVVGLLTAILLFLAYFILLPFRILFAVFGACIVVARIEARQRQEMGFDQGGYDGGYESFYGGEEGMWGRRLHRITTKIGNSRAWSLDAWNAYNNKYKNE